MTTKRIRKKRAKRSKKVMSLLSFLKAAFEEIYGPRPESQKDKE